METVKITTSQNIEIDYPVATLGDRIGARCIDLLIFMTLSSFFSTYLAVAIGRGDDELTTTRIIGIVVWLAMIVFYDLIAEIFFNGQSIGKRALKMRVISLDGARPTFGQYFLRWLFRIIDFGVSAGSLAVVAVAFSEKNQRVGDVAAGTTVVKVKPQDKYAGLFFNMPDQEEYTPVFPEVTQLSDADIHLVHDVIKNFNFTRNSELVYKLAKRIKAYLKVSYGKEMNEYQFLEVLVNDYTNLTGRTDA